MEHGEILLGALLGTKCAFDKTSSTSIKPAATDHATEPMIYE
jgi:hypothetical protein